MKDIAEIVSEANKKDMRLYMNGAPTQRTVQMTINPPMGKMHGQASPRLLTISLADDKRTITGQYERNSIPLTIAVNASNVVSLMSGDKEVTSRDAARIFMEGFLFEGDSPFSAHV